MIAWQGCFRRRRWPGRYGQDALAQEISTRWLATVAREYQASGKMLEKYDVEEAKAGGGGEYPLQDGFGWTNGVTRVRSDMYPARRPELNRHAREVR
uniref:Neutral trehalase-like protein n=1 Tax=Caulobacter sp. (strain K31) TaxID=366602 RepID=B0T9K0_CAUSK